MLYFLSLILLFSGACKKDDDPEITEEQCGDVNASFNEQVLPIFTGSCAFSGCHSSASAEAGFVFDNYENIKSAIESDQAGFLASINFEGNSSGWMPRSNPSDPAQPQNQLPQSDIEKIECWIVKGMPND